ncbi:MAG: ERAP1-like C-terminal domain-containing protein, partial [Deltaproteobacteria bacterium]|nr:ERAP1-like C-terminal domain-containing protein [Deltaproteobacteria bacterium]
ARVGFLSNAWALVEAGEFGLVDLLAILEEFRGDRAREVVELVVEVLSRIDDSVIAEEARASFDRWVASLLGPIHEELGWEAKPGEPESHRLLREVVLDALARHEPDRKLKAEAARRAKAYLREPASVPVDIAGVALRVAARTGGIAYEPVRAALGTRSEPEHRVRILRALGSFGDAEPITRALDLVLSGEVRATDLRYVARGAARGASSRRALIDWLEAHFAELAKELGPGSAAELLSVVERGCSAEERGRAAATFRPLLQRAGSPTRRLDEALEGAAACTELRRREEGSATRWLGARAGERRER